MKTWRVIDTGVRSAVENLALNRAMLEARAANEIPSTLRFVQFRPSALLGYHQAAEQELNLDYCAEHGIAIQRRITGGGAIYFDQKQIGWELYLAREDVSGLDMQAIAQHICEAAAKGISALGVDARYRPRNDIEVSGRKISGTGGAFDGHALMYQGTLLIDFDVERMLRCLRIPAEKLSDKALASARERVVSLRELLGYTPQLPAIKHAIVTAFVQAFGVELVPGDLTASEHRRLAVALREMDHPDWVYLVSRPESALPILEASQKFSGGLLRVALTFDRLTQTIRQIWFSGDMFVSPRRAIADLEAALRDVALDRYEAMILEFFAGREVDMLTLTAADFAAVARSALAAETQPMSVPP